MTPVPYLDEGMPSDPRSVKLATARGNWIKNFRRKEANQEVLIAREEKYRGVYHTRKFRSFSSSTYNCVSLLFAARRTWVETDELELIFEDDPLECIDISDVDTGDIVAYRNNEGEYSHVAVVLCKVTIPETGDFQITVLSKWGDHGEYVHEAHDLPQMRLGTPAEYWSYRRGEPVEGPDGDPDPAGDVSP